MKRAELLSEVERCFGRRCFLIVLVTGLTLACLSSCVDRSVGWGVVLWTPEPSVIDTGAVLAISSESEIQDVYRYADAETVREIDRWRVRLFLDRQQAEDFAEVFSGLINVYGYAARNGLPVREAADTISPRLYRLREGEVVKVIARSEFPIDVGAYTNHWFQVITADGTQGFTFGEFLPLFETYDNPQVEADRLRRYDPVLLRLINSEWRPQYYADMLASRRIDLTRMTQEYGLTVKPHRKDELESAGDISTFHSAGTVRIQLPDLDLTFDYESIERIREGLYILQGTGVRIAVQSERRVAVSFQHDSRLQTEVFITLRAKVSDLISSERERREIIYDMLRERGPLLRSRAYGDLLLMPAWRFRWSGFQRLVPGVMPADASGTGTISLRLHPQPELRFEFPGVLTFELDRLEISSDLVSVSFLYRRDSEGIRLVLAGEIDEDLMQVQSAASTPLTIYFRYGG